MISRVGARLAFCFQLAHSTGAIVSVARSGMQMYSIRNTCGQFVLPPPLSRRHHTQTEPLFEILIFQIDARRRASEFECVFYSNMRSAQVVHHNILLCIHITRLKLNHIFASGVTNPILVELIGF